MLKIAIGASLQPGPWGGGNQALGAITQALNELGHKVVHDLDHSELDLILLTEPRKHLAVSAFNHVDIYRYLVRYPKTVVVHRINECDERKGTKGVNRLIMRANRCATHTVFVGDWLQRLYMSQGYCPRSASVILNGADKEIFNSQHYKVWTGQGQLRIVTHHWGRAWQKGFDIYQRLDNLLDSDEYQQRFSFTYIGNLPDGFRFKNARYIEPLSGEALAGEISSHHVYLTASRNEPGSNHQNEGACCGLPLLYIGSGSLPEYCEGFGIEFTVEDFLQKLELMEHQYSSLIENMKNYPHTSIKMAMKYHQLFQSLLASKAGQSSAGLSERATYALEWMKAIARND